MKFSLILCTLGRTKEVSEFLISLLQQTYSDYELILVDQNHDDRVVNILDEVWFPSDKLKYIRQDIPGLSRARNIGLKCAVGDIIAFPDDDCLYDVNVLESVVTFFSSNPHVRVLSVNTKDMKSDGALMCLPSVDCNFHRERLLGCSFTIFFSSDALNYRFDERLGVGSGFIWGASEEHDFLYRFMQKDEFASFLTSVYVFHPAKESNTLDIKRAYFYGAGLAAFRCKHFSRWRRVKSAALLAYQVITSLFAFNWRKMVFKAYFLCGYIMGCIMWRLALR